jgi:hypothetical protein
MRAATWALNNSVDVDLAVCDNNKPGTGSGSDGGWGFY